MQAILQAQGICKSLPNGKSLLRNISFDVHPGEFVGILGPSGAGKSLTLRSLLGLMKPDCGQVTLRAKANTYSMNRIEGRTLRHARREMGVIFQGLNLVRRLTVLDNVMIGGLGRIHPLRSWLYGFKDCEARDAMDVLHRLKMTELAPRRASTLSGGELQRVAIARAMYQQPSLFLADEPISNLDPSTAEQIMSLLKDLSHQSPVLCTLHQPEMARQFCTRLVGVRAGEIVYNGSPHVSAAALKEIYGQEIARFGPAGPHENHPNQIGATTAPSRAHVMAEAGT